MKVTWSKNKKLDKQIILKRLKEGASLDSEGRVSFRGVEQFELRSVLYSMIDFHKVYSYETSMALFRKTLSDWLAGSEFTSDEFMRFMNARVIEYAKLPDSEFVMVAYLSIADGLPINRIVTPGAIVKCYPRGLPKKYSSHETLLDAWRQKEAPIPSGYCPVVVRCKSKNKMDAVELASQELDFVRSVFCLSINSNYVVSLPFDRGSRRSLNSIQLGGMRTLHTPKGGLSAKDTYWYDEDYEERAVSDVKRTKRRSASRFFKEAMQRIQQHPEPYVIKDCLIRFVRAFDAKDKNFALQKAWSALESLVAPGENSGEAIVRRCSFMFEEYEYHKQVLEHLRHYRNKSVHNDRSIENPTDYCYQLQKYFRQAVAFHVFRGAAFSSIQEANEFLDLPIDVDKLKRRKALLESAIEYLSPKKS